MQFRESEGPLGLASGVIRPGRSRELRVFYRMSDLRTYK